MNAEMTYGRLGRSGLLVSRIGLGTMNFGYTVDESSSFAVMDSAIHAGINFFDTADVYGGPQSPDMAKGYGVAEETVGRAAHQGPEVDGSVTLDVGHAGVVGTFVDAVVTGSDGADLRAVA